MSLQSGDVNPIVNPAHPFARQAGLRLAMPMPGAA
jgi:hypothetical protein